MSQEFSCQACDLHKTKGRGYVRGKGNPKAAVFVIGGAPSRWDAEKTTPLMGEAGIIFEKALGDAKLSRADLFISYMVKCHPGDATPTDAQYATCSQHLDYEVSNVKPKVLLLLGDDAVRQILGKEPTPGIRGHIWDSKECAKFFTFSAGEVIGYDDATGAEYRSNAEGAFKIVIGPDPMEAVGNNHLTKELVRALQTAAKVSAGNMEAKNRNYKYAHTEQDVFAMLVEILERCERSKFLSFDIETSGLVGYRRMHDPDHLKAEALSIAFSFRPGNAYAMTLRSKHRSPRVVDMLRKVLEHPIAKMGHNGNFDNILLRQDMGIIVKNYAFDTFVAAYAIDQDSNSKGLDDQAAPIRPDLGRWWEKAEPHLDKKKYGYLNCPDDILLEYNACDADATFSLTQELGPKLKLLGREDLYYTILMPHYREIAEMQFFGVRLDVEGAKALGKSMLAKVQAAEKLCLSKVGRHPHWWGADELAENGIELKDFRPFNLSSSQQLGELVYGELKAPVVVKSDKGAPSTSLEAMAPLKKDFPFIADLLEYRKDQKFMSTFIGWEAKPKPSGNTNNMELFAVPEWIREGVKTDGTGMLACVGEDGRLHPELHIDGTETGRISITAPALQTIPKTKELRNLLIPADGYVFVDADFKALELRIIAVLSGDPEFIRIFKEGLDPHSVTASKMFGIPIELPPTATKEERDAYFKIWNEKHKDARKKAKAVNFGIPYGEGAAGLADQLKVPESEAQKWLDDWATKTFPVAARWLKKTVDESRKTAGVTYSLNRFRPLPGFLSKRQGDQGQAERQAKNTPIQGTGGDCTSLSIVRIHERFRKELGPTWSDIARIVLEVHDQIVVEVLKDWADRVKEWVIEEMSRQMPFLPPTLQMEVDADIKVKWGD